MSARLHLRTQPATVAVGAMIAAFAVAGAMALAGDRALASHVGCGDTITADTTLDSNLVNCPSNGIVIGADDITLDLNGHLIDGDGTPFAACPQDVFCDVGVVNDGHDGVTVRDGSVRQFDVGAFVGSARHNRVLGISSSRNVFFGIVVADSARSLVRNSSGNGNLAPDGDGMGLFASHHVRILHNSFRHNAQLGIHVVDSTNNLIKRNVFARNSDFGIAMEADRNRVRRNRCARNATCILVGGGSRNVIAQNRIFEDGVGIAIEKGHGNLVVGNVVVHPALAGIYLGLNSPPIGGSHNVVRRNLVRGSGDDAFKVRETDDHSRLKRNIAVGAAGAGGDGFDVESRTAKLTGNRAVRNADLGIEAVPGIIDGGGNIGRHNGDPRQCLNVVC